MDKEGGLYFPLLKPALLAQRGFAAALASSKTSSPKSAIMSAAAIAPPAANQQSGVLYLKGRIAKATKDKADALEVEDYDGAKEFKEELTRLEEELRAAEAAAAATAAAAAAVAVSAAANSAASSSSSIPPTPKVGTASGSGGE